MNSTKLYFGIGALVVLVFIVMSAGNFRFPLSVVQSGEMLISGTPDNIRMDIQYNPTSSQCPREEDYNFNIFVGSFPSDYHRCPVSAPEEYRNLCNAVSNLEVTENTMEFSWRGGSYPLKVVRYDSSSIVFTPDWGRIGYPDNGDWGPFSQCPYQVSISGYVVLESDVSPEPDECTSIPSKPCGLATWTDYPTCTWDTSTCQTPEPEPPPDGGDDGLFIVALAVLIIFGLVGVYVWRFR